MIFALPVIAAIVLLLLSGAVGKGAISNTEAVEAFWCIVAVLGLTGLGSIATTLSELKEVLERLTNKIAPEE